jgi:UDP-N-acetylglucosamine 2-epimerase (non-hydrolysing)
VTVTLGTSRLVGNDPVAIAAAFDDVLHGRWRSAQPIPLWDGRAGERVAAELAAWVNSARLVTQ